MTRAGDRERNPTPPQPLPTWRKFLSPRGYRWLVIVWIALSLGGITMGVVVWHRLNTSVDASIANAQFKGELDRVRSLLQDAETGQRGYLLTEDESYLAPYQRAVADIPATFERLRALALGEAALTTHVNKLHEIVTVKLLELQRSISTRRAQGLDAAIALVRTNEGREAMDEFRALVQTMNRRPQDLFFAHNLETRKGIQGALVTTVAASLAGLGAGLLAFYLARLTLKHEREARALAERATQASQLAQEKSAFLANMSHEIRTPMNAILGFSDLLTAALPTEAKTFHYARSIRESAQSLLQLINDILDLSKVEAGMMDLHVEPTDVRELAGFIRTVFLQQAARQDLKLEIVVAPAVPRSLMLDNSRLRQVLVNLVGNALKFTEHGGVTLHVNWEADPSTPGQGTLLATLTDTGVGIPADRLEDVFQPFVQVDRRRTAEQHGTGLGLSIVRRLMERMGGTVALTSVVGQGSTFRLRLPGTGISAQAPARIAEEDGAEVDFNTLAPATVLVVDDNAVNRELLAGLFDLTHHTVRYAANGREAVESVRHEIPNVVLMDIRMPQMDGESALREIRKIVSAEKCPVIAVTASGMKQDEHHLREVFSGYVRKPYTQSQLFRAMEPFLPKASGRPVPVAAAPANGHTPRPAAVTPESRDRWPELVKTLRQIEASQWPAVHASGAIFETREFARHLANLGRTAACPPLIDYAAALTRDAESYAIGSLEKHLTEFPHVIQSIADQAQPLTR